MTPAPIRTTSVAVASLMGFSPPSLKFQRAAQSQHELTDGRVMPLECAAVSRKEMLDDDTRALSPRAAGKIDLSLLEA
jgi:hypothetical protein